MKKILLTITLITVTLLGMAQAPNLLNYQGVARNAVGNVIPNQLIGLRLSILSGGPAGTLVYQETRTVFTNAFGLFTVKMGDPLGILNQVGTIAGVNWSGLPSGAATKYLQVEIDPQGGSNFTSVGSTQMVSVPYALTAGGAAPIGPAGGDLTGTYPNPQIFFPLLKTFNSTTLTPSNTELIGMTNSSPTSLNGAITGTSASTTASATAVSGTMSSSSPGGFSSGLKGVNNGTGGLGIGVTGTQAGSGWGVYGTTPAGIGVYGLSTSGYGVYGQSTSGPSVYGINGGTSNAGLFQNSNAANTADVLASTSNGVGNAVSGINSGTGRGGFFQVNNAASTANALEVTSNGTGASWGIRANNTGTNGAGLFVQSNAANTANNVQSNQAGLGRAGLFQNTNTANTADALTATTVTTDVTPAAVHGINGNAGITVTAKKGGWFETDNGIGSFGTSNNGGAGTYGVGNNGSVGVQALTFGTAPAFFGTSLGGRAVDVSLAAGNNSNVINAVTTGNGTVVNAQTNGASTGVAGSFVNTNTANAANTLRAQNANITGTGFGNSTAYLERGTPSPVNNYLWTGVPTAVTGIVDAGVGISGSSSNVYAVSGLTNNGIGLVGYAVNPAGYAIATVGRLQFSGQGAAVGRILGATTAAGDATWQTPAALGIVSGSGTLNFVPKWTPNGTTIGNSQVFDNGTSVGIGAGAAPLAWKLDVLSGTQQIMSHRAPGVPSFDLYYNQTNNFTGYVGTWNVATSNNNFDIGTGDINSTGSLNLATQAIARMSILPNGNVGVNTTAPSYKFQVVHGGGDGISVKSTAGYSVTDIDAQNGDAALRFYKNGVWDWHIGVQVINGLSFYDLKTGSLRMGILNGTGNVQIGTNTIGSKLTIGGVTQANNTITTVSGFPGTNVLGINEATAVAGEKWGTYTSVDGGASSNIAVVTETGTTGGVNLGLFSRVSAAPAGGQSYGVFAFDAVNNANTWAAKIVGRLNYTDGNQANGNVLVSDASGNASWQNLVPNVGIGLQNLNTNVTIPANSFLPITQWQNITHETGGANYNNVTGEYTITVAGVYQVNASLAVNPGGNGAIDMYVTVNGGTILSEATEYVQPTGYSYGFNINVLRKLNVGDKLQVTVGQNIGAASTIPGGFQANNFSVQLVRRN